MAYPIKVCSVCGEQFELKPDKPGFANRCPDCTDAEGEATGEKSPAGAAEHENKREAARERREAMRNLLYRKDS